jgi:RNA polymerase sigma factor (sigma-70 family)
MTFDSLAKKLTPTLKRISYKAAYRGSYFNEEDLLQEALVRLWQDFNAGKLQDKTDSYILQGAYFHLKNYIRTYREKAKVSSLEAILSAEERDFSLEELVEDKESLDYRDTLNDQMLADAIRNNGLNPKEKLIVSLCADGLTMRDIGKRLGVSHVSVVKAMRKIREKCQKHLDRDGSQVNLEVSP